MVRGLGIQEPKSGGGASRVGEQKAAKGGGGFGEERHWANGLLACFLLLKLVVDKLLMTT